MTDGLTMSPIELSWTAKKTLTHQSIFWEMGNDEYRIMPNYHTVIMISIADENLSISLTE